MQNTIVKFVREKDLVLKTKLGKGACGETVLLYDDVIDEHFVCKKYAPYDDALKPQLFKNFIGEIKLLHLVNHANIVRVFNYYLYPEHFAGYILMEYIKGSDIGTYLKNTPENVNGIFTQVINGFSYLEEKRILHRDIRLPNIMVNIIGQVKIIDFGFGKKISVPEDFDKSITLNWWCDLPADFDEAKYSFSTEVYFVGKLFEKIILENQIEHFGYKNILTKMCQKNPNQRIQSFGEVEREVSSGQISSNSFSEDEINVYREFSQSLYLCIPKIEESARYKTSSEDLERILEDLYKNVMLEEYLPSISALAQCFFIDGSYYTSRNHYFEVSLLKSFLNLLKLNTQDKKNIVVRNLHSKLDSVKRYTDKEINLYSGDDIPF